MRILSRHAAAERRFAPWRNGGGETAEILCDPPGAGFDDFGWRISTARVAASGPFSRFEGVTRVLAVIEGGRMALHLADGRVLGIGPGEAPLRFPGGTGCDCRLEGAPLLDLNVMTRSPFTAEVFAAGTGTGTGAGGPGALVARLLFALRPLPGLGLGRLDLAAIDGLPEGLGPDAALVIEIRRDPSAAGAAS